MKNIFSLKKTIFVLLGSVALNSFSQTIAFDKYVPSDPTAASLTKYVITPVGYYTGIPSVGVPFYTIQSGNINVPISLSYHSGGIKINEESGEVGLGWALNAGGMISRSINYKDDFDSYLSHSYPNPDPPLNGSGFFDPSGSSVRERGLDCKLPANGVQVSFPSFMSNTDIAAQQDWVPDTFFYNFNGYSGSFWLDRNGNAHLSKKEDISIKLLSKLIGNWIVKTPDGTTYEFMQPQNTYVIQDAGDGGGYISSWLLTKITDFKGQSVTFTYLQKELYTPIRSFTQSISNDVNFINNFGGKPTSIQGIYLSEILFDTGKVKFNYSNAGERLDIKNTYFVKSVEVFNKINGIYAKIKDITLQHGYFGSSTPVPTTSNLYPGNGDYYSLVSSDSHPILRLKLAGVTIDTEQKYAFEYNEQPTTTPTKTTMGQDYWGYYNGAGNINSFIPVSVTYVATGTTSQKANRVAVESKAKIFTLKKISYPTGGYTTFEQELNTYKNIGTAGGTVPQTVQKSDNVVSNGGLVTKQVTLGGNGYRINLSTTAFVKSTAINGSGDIAGINFAYQQVGVNDLYVELVNSQGVVLQRMSFVDKLNPSVSYQSTVLGFNEVRDVNIPAGTYTLRAYANPTHALITGNTAITVFWEETQASPTEAFAKGGGLRVSSVSDYDANGNLEVKRMFDYHYDVAGVTNSHGRLMSFPDYLTIVNKPIGSTGDTYTVPTVRAGSSTDLSTEQGSFVGYDQVDVSFISSTGIKNGKTTYKYKNQQDLFNTSMSQYKYYLDNSFQFPRVRIPSNGILYEEDHYNLNSSNQFVLVRKVENGYTINGISAANFVLSDLTKNTDYVQGGLLINYGADSQDGSYSVCDDSSFLFYPYYSNNIRQTSTTETVYDLLGLNPVVTTQNFYYDNPNHYQITRSVATDSKGKTITNKTYYPKDVTSLLSLGESLTSLEKVAIDSLASQHRIAEPVQTEVSQNGTIISTQRKNYKLFPGNFVLPEIVQTLKSTASGTNLLLDRLQYHSYDDFGNPREISKKDGVHIVFLWGYNHTYPIAKIDNAAYASIPSNLITTAVNASNADNDRTTGSVGSEGTLRTALQAIRDALPNAQTTTYTYDPLIGVTSITDPRGYTTYYTYDTQNRLEYIEDKDSKVLQQYRYNYQVPQIIASTTPSATSVNSGTTVTFTTTATGGSGSFSYKWTVSNATLNQATTTATGSFSVTTTASHAPAFTLTCEVTDTQTGEKVTTSTQVVVSTFSPLGVTMTASSTSVTSGTTVSFTTTPSGGSGSFSYKWTVSNATLNQVTTTAIGSFSVTTTTSHAPSFTLTCEVTDTQTGQKVTTSKVVTVSSFAVGNITYSPTGTRSVNTAMAFNITASGGSGNFAYEWKRINNSGTSGVLSVFNSLFYTISSSDCSFFTIQCKVTDVSTGASITKTVGLTVSCF